MEEQNRRHDDMTVTGKHRAYKISELIEQEDDPKQRAFLIVLHEISTSLNDNTSVTKDIGNRLTKIGQELNDHIDEFSAHRAEEEKLVAKVSGAWKVAAWVAGCVQVIILGLAGVAWNDLTTIHAHMNENTVQHTQLDARVDVLEKIEAAEKAHRAE